MDLLKKNNDKDYNICNMGHKFCNKCGEKYHENEKCKEEENIDKLFEKFSRRYNLKNCPYCHIVVLKNGGCNHMHCKYCGKDWCWLCNEIFKTTEEHYGNRNSKCYNQMMNNNNEIIICSKCDREINDNFKRFRCDHIICNNCFIQYLLESSVIIIFPVNIIRCAIIGCNDIKEMSARQIIEFINESNNEKLIRKYKRSILYSEYALQPIFVLCSYFDILFGLYELIANLFDCCQNYKIYYLLIGIGIFFGCIFILVFIFLIPMFPIYVLIKLYFFKFIPEIKNQYNNNLIIFFIILVEVILSLALLFPLFIIHYIFFAFLPIFGLIMLIRALYYRLRIC